jgi:hypothetical protein
MDIEKKIKLLNSLRLPEEPQERKVAGFYEGQAITNEWASQVDWVKETNNFDLNTISELVKNIGKSKKEKKIVIKAIYDAMEEIGEMYKIPYSVDGLLNDLYKKYDENGRGLLPSVDTNELSPELISLFKRKMEEYIADKQNNNESSSENSDALLQQIEDLKAEINKLAAENAAIKENLKEEPESAFNTTGNNCFTKAKMGLLIHTIASITDGPIPVKAQLVPIISAIGGWEATSVNSEMKKAGFKQTDINAVAELFENAMPNFAAEIKKQIARPPKTKK